MATYKCTAHSAKQSPDRSRRLGQGRNSRGRAMDARSINISDEQPKRSGENSGRLLHEFAVGVRPSKLNHIFEARTKQKLQEVPSTCPMLEVWLTTNCVCCHRELTLRTSQHNDDTSATNKLTTGSAPARPTRGLVGRPDPIRKLFQTISCDTCFTQVRRKRTSNS